MSRIVAILGTAPSSRMEANEQPPEVERWGQSGCWRYIQNLDRWFEMHDRAWILRRAGKGFFPYLFFMQQFKGPVYMNKLDSTIKNAVQYPLEEMNQKFFGDDPPYFTSSIAYMTALAIHEGVDEIRYFGVDMAHKMEYIHQRSGCEYFMGWARAVGIKVVLPKTSPIMKSPLYGQRRNTEVIQESIHERNAKLSNAEQHLAEALIGVRGRLQELLASNGTSRPRRSARYKLLKEEERTFEEKLNNLRGKINENEFWLAEEKGLELTQAIPQGPLVYAKGKQSNAT
jgi:hypothetical protein